MASLYSSEIRHIIVTAPWPKGLKYDVYEFGGEWPRLELTFYRDNLATMTGTDKEKIQLILLNTIVPINESGIPIIPNLKDARID